MSLAEQLVSDLRAAMIAGDTVRRDVIRFLRASITNAEIELHRALTDDEILGVIRGQIKQRRDSIELFRKGGREDLAESETAQIGILQDYL
ncbi:MAG TPA: glutamyl-tRNA amidotransferase, partial [Chloroflexi bacterium]|nr:glutamyl-tRNA amidotransferase [Chloroflexota bacterium]